MEYIKIKHIYDFISLFPLVLFAYGISDIFMNNNYYILIGIFISSGIQRSIKIMTTSWNPNIFKRPDNARDVGGFNTGGYVGDKSGFPSGHTLCVSYVMNYLIFINNGNFFTTDSIAKQLIIVMVAYARVKKGAHRIVQVIAGYIFGLALAYGIYRLQ
jgi:membrane-associated phospholipid phosphatase